MNQEELKQRLIELVGYCSCRYSPPCTGECAECINVDMRDRQIEYIADHLIANGVTILERGEWIPVTERLPENDYGKHWKERNRYLVYTKPTGLMYTAKYGYKDHLWWVDSHNCVLSATNYKNVTHWMPLPLPPEKENEDG